MGTPVLTERSLDSTGLLALKVRRRHGDLHRLLDAQHARVCELVVRLPRRNERYGVEAGPQIESRVSVFKLVTLEAVPVPARLAAQPATSVEVVMRILAGALGAANLSHDGAKQGSQGRERRADKQDKALCYAENVEIGHGVCGIKVSVGVFCALDVRFEGGTYRLGQQPGLQTPDQRWQACR